MRYPARSLFAALLLTLAAPPAPAEVPAWLTGNWATNARLTAPDGARLRIRCTLNAGAGPDGDWGGVLGCATVQGRFEGRWQITLADGNAAGNVVFTGAQAADLPVAGNLDGTRLSLQSDDGQAVTFSPGEDGALVVGMQALGPQRLTGALSFEPR